MNGDPLQARVRARLRREIIRLRIALTCAWIFAAFSYYLSRKTGADWFPRSGSVMVLIGAAATFRLVGLFQAELAIALNEKLSQSEHAFQEVLTILSREAELALKPPDRYQSVSYFAYATGIAGTAIWGYGDKLAGFALALFS